MLCCSGSTSVNRNKCVGPQTLSLFVFCKINKLILWGCKDNVGQVIEASVFI